MHKSIPPAIRKPLSHLQGRIHLAQVEGGLILHNHTNGPCLQNDLNNHRSPGQRKRGYSTFFSVILLLACVTETDESLCIRYTPCSYRGMEDRLPHGSLSRLTDPSQHSSSHRLNDHSRHSSARDLSGNPVTHITHGTSMNRVIEEDGTSA